MPKTCTGTPRDFPASINQAMLDISNENPEGGIEYELDCLSAEENINNYVDHMNSANN